jgi:hypothetical protein
MFLVNKLELHIVNFQFFNSVLVNHFELQIARFQVFNSINKKNEPPLFATVFVVYSHYYMFRPT